MPSSASKLSKFFGAQLVVSPSDEWVSLLSSGVKYSDSELLQVRSFNSSLVFHKVVSTLAAVTRKKGINLHSYLDDWLLRNQEKGSLSLQRDALISLTQLCGFLFFFKKSLLEPTQDLVFIGVRFRTDLGLMLQPDMRIKDILDRTSSMQVATTVIARQFLSFLDLLNSATDQIPLGRLHM